MLITHCAQLWQWCKHHVTLPSGQKVTKELCLKLLKEQTEKLEKGAPKGNKYQLAARYFAPQCTGESYAEFLTSLLYNEIVTAEAPQAVMAAKL